VRGRFKEGERDVHIEKGEGEGKVERGRGSTLRPLTILDDSGHGGR